MNRPGVLWGTRILGCALHLSNENNVVLYRAPLITLFRETYPYSASDFTPTIASLITVILYKYVNSRMEEHALITTIVLQDCVLAKYVHQDY